MNFVPASVADIDSLRSMEINLPEGSTLYGDTGFLDRLFEKVLQETSGIDLVVPRRKNMKDQLEGCVAYLYSLHRQRVETTFSELTAKFSRRIHCVTARGFEIKVFLAILAFAVLH
jgi:hypothetical protein